MLKITQSNQEVRLPAEFPLRLVVDDIEITTFLCSPQDLEDMVIGALYIRGIIRGVHDLTDISVDPSNCSAIVKTSRKLPAREISLGKVFCPTASGDLDIVDFPSGHRILNNNHQISQRQLVEIALHVEHNMPLFRDTGGVHAVALAASDHIIVREDVGRHNAMDKVIGATLREGADFSAAVICATGRISVDMLAKAAIVGVPVIASMKEPTTLGVQLANHCGIAIIGNVLSSSPRIFSTPWRILA